MYYKITERLIESTMEDCLDGHTKYVAVLTPDEWKKDQENFRMGIEMEIERHPHTTKAEVNYDRHDLTGRDHEFAFALDENGVVLIDEEGYARNIVRSIAQKKKWHVQALERFLYDFLESMIRGDSTLLEAIEDELQHMEEDILEGKTEKEIFSRISEIRGDLLALRTHYLQLISFGQVLSENENEFFAEQNLRYFDMSVPAGRPSEQHRHGPDSHHDHLHAPDPDRRLVRHEFQVHAGTGISLRVSAGHRRQPAHHRSQPALLQI